MIYSLITALMAQAANLKAIMFDLDVDVYETVADCNQRLTVLARKAEKVINKQEDPKKPNFSKEDSEILQNIKEEREALMSRRSTLEEKQKQDAEFLALAHTDVDAHNAALNPVAGANQNANSPIKIVSEGFEHDPKANFRNIHEFLETVMVIGKDPDSNKARNLRNSPRMKFLSSANFQMAAGSDEHSTQHDAYGGYLVPTGLIPGVMEGVVEADFMAGFVRTIPMNFPKVEMIARVDKDHSTSVSGGFQVYRRTETQSQAASRTELERVSYVADYMQGITYVTEELVEQSPASVIGMIETGFEQEFASALIQERIRGTGVGEFEGVLNTPSLITASAEAGQAADTILGENLLAMRKRCWGYGNAIWVANLDTYDQVVTASIESPNYAGVIKLFNPDFSGGFEGRILGRPVFFTEYASAIGDVGDIMLLNLSEYIQMNYSPLRRAESMHVRFLNRERTFRFDLSNAAKSPWRSVLTPKLGANTLSPFVTLAAR